MTEEEWYASDDPLAMLDALRSHWRGERADLVRLTRRYLLACCRAIWKLLPMEASRRGVEVAECYIEGRATREEFHSAEWAAEGAALFLEPFEWQPEEEDPDAKEARVRYEVEKKARIETLVRDVEAIPSEEMRRMVRASTDDANLSPHQLLSDAAYFADVAMYYPGDGPGEVAIERYSRFLSASLLRVLVGSLFPPEASGHERKL